MWPSSHTVIRSTTSPAHPAAPYTGPVDALWKICASESAPNMVTVTELVNAGIDVNYAVSGRDKARGQARDRGKGAVTLCSLLFYRLLRVPSFSPRSFPSRRSSFTHSFTHVF